MKNKFKEKKLKKIILLSAGNRVINNTYWKTSPNKKAFNLKQFEKNHKIEFCKLWKKTKQAQKIYFLQILPSCLFKKGTNKIKLSK